MSVEYDLGYYITFEQYKRMRLFDGMTDQDILESVGLNRTSKRIIQRFKKKYGIVGKDKTQLLDKKEIILYLETHDKITTAENFGINPNSFYKWYNDNIKE